MDAPTDTLPQITPGRRLTASVDGVFAAMGDNFVSAPTEKLVVGFDGIRDDFHAGLTRKSGGREPWYPRGTEMRNERQLSILCRKELDLAAADMGLETIAPEWVGANLTLAGIDMLSMLPAATLLFFEGGVTLKVDFQNGPCKFAGEAIANHVGRTGDTDLAMAFPRAAKRRRGLVAWVEKPGEISLGESLRVQVPEQWIYPA